MAIFPIIDYNEFVYRTQINIPQDTESKKDTETLETMNSTFLTVWFIISVVNRVEYRWLKQTNHV